MKYDFDTVISRYGTYCTKYDGLQKFAGPAADADSIPLFVADMDLPTADSILDALRKTVDFRMFGYTLAECSPEYAPAVCQWWKKRFDTDLDPDWVLFSPGTVAAIDAAIEIFSHPGDGIVLQRPVYGHFSQDIEKLHRRPVSSHLIAGENGDYRMDFDDLEQKCADPNNTIMILCSPANPVGRVWTEEEIRRVAEITARHHMLLISDEVHCDIVRKSAEHKPVLKAVPNADHIIMTTAINKTFNLAGLACSNVIIPNPLLRKRFSTYFGMQMANPFSVSALLAAYTEADAEGWLNQVNAYIDGNLSLVKEFFDTRMPWVKTYIPQGTYCMWIDFRKSGLSDAEIHKRIYDDAKVILQDGIVHDPEEGACFQRLCVPCARSVLTEALERIEAQFKDIS